MSEQTLSNLSREERRFEPPAELAEHANVKEEAYARAAADPEAEAELRAALAGRRESVAAWLAGSVLRFRSDLTEAQVNAVYLALTRVEVYQELVEVWGWTPEAYEQWLAGVLEQQLLP